MLICMVIDTAGPIQNRTGRIGIINNKSVCVASMAMVEKSEGDGGRIALPFGATADWRSRAAGRNRLAERGAAPRSSRLTRPARPSRPILELERQGGRYETDNGDPGR